MALTVKNLGNGTLPNVTGALYTAPSLTTAIVRSISLVNTDSSSHTVNIYVKGKRILDKDKSLSAGASFVIDWVITLGPADAITGDADAASKVDYVISGVERT